MTDILDVLVIGGGQAGLVMGYHLAERGHRFLIVDAGADIGHAWRSRWDSLQLFTPAQFDNLPGMPFPATRDTYPGKDDVADFLQAYAARFQLPVQLNTTVDSLTRSDDRFVVTTGRGDVQARQVVVATGPFHTPFVPPIANRLDADMPQIHSVEYRRPQAIPAGKVLVVGAANSGCQIALELSATHTVELATGQRIPTIPQRPLGRDVWWWASGIRLDRVTVGSRLGKRLSGRDQVIGDGPRQLAKRHGVRIRARATMATGRTVTFADGTASEYDAVVWATGFTANYSWIAVPGVHDEQGRILHQRGVTPSPGLYMLGLTWQHTRTSALLGWIGSDASYLANQIATASDNLTGHQLHP
ncbi:putative flavoprotein involved in K+ transport [Kribbella steppae]|uniref:Putative flavoprotein involved in K+ transport n=1 Tax=Kribbella steppae TaxID=2512223 RepID=A0A4R2HX07_9ACTN|nr:NAD(P)/FAD-dependent oxidoreductase [Kribbella steppae]TCO36014.1 putative flavoprotein involved in K+ transport [Kribbella steppae]